MRNLIPLFAVCLTCLAAAPTSTAPAHNQVASSKHSKKAVRRTPVRSWRAGQMAPDSERYKAIQEALVKKGYLHAEPSGKWDEESTDALRRFQQDQNLEPSGKLNSLSIIALGLGPKYDASAGKAPVQPIGVEPH